MENLRGAALMMLAMVCFTVSDMFVKMLGGTIPGPQVIGFLGLGGATIFGAMALWQRQPPLCRSMANWLVVVRNTGEIAGTFGLITALILMPFSTVSAILQAAPLLVTLGAALFLGEAVGWRRWTAIAVGFFGVLLVIRPGMEGFDENSVFALFGVGGLSLRDLATRRIPAGISSVQLACLAFLLLLPASVLFSALSGQTWVRPDPPLLGVLAAALVSAAAAYYAIVGATRQGDISFIAPFRYTRIVFALGIGVVVFGEHLDSLTLAGTAIIVASGFYMFLRERKLGAAA